MSIAKSKTSSATTVPLADLITVVIPTIEGRENLLVEAVESCRNQSCGEEPMIVTCLDKGRSGPAWIRNEVMRQVWTPWALFLDDDDVLHEDYFERMVPHLTGKYSVVYSWCVEMGFSAGLDHDFDPEVLRGANFIPVTACVKTEMFRRVGGFPLGIAYEDWGLWLRILDAGGKFKNVPEKLWTYRRHEGSRTHQNQHDIAMGRIPQV